MERFNDLAIVLKNFPYQERDRIAVCLTENHGRITGLAKGGIHSRRFGGTLDFLACSRIEFIQKPNAELARIEEATSHHEFANIAREFDRLTCASFAAEFCTRLLESNSPSREMFVILSNILYQLDAGMPSHLAINTFLCKAFKAMGYPPSLFRCVQCAKGAHEINEEFSSRRGASVERALYYWYSEAGGMVCWECAKGRFKTALESETLLFFHKLTMTPFRELTWDKTQNTVHAGEPHTHLYRLLADFLHHHIPGLPQGGLKSWKLLNDALAGAAQDVELRGLPPRLAMERLQAAARAETDF
jgi:DNA repair protein RecO